MLSISVTGDCVSNQGEGSPPGQVQRGGRCMAIDLVPETAIGMSSARARAARRGRGKAYRESLARMWFYRYLYLLMLPGLLFFLVFAYIPMWGIIIAFQDFHLSQCSLGSPWVGLDHFSR